MSVPSVRDLSTSESNTPLQLVAPPIACSLSRAVSRIGEKLMCFRPTSYMMEWGDRTARTSPRADLELNMLVLAF